MKRILICYSHFFPAFKAGGPVRSLQNLVDILNKDFEIDVICSSRDLGDRERLPGITPGKWNAYGENINVLYVEHAPIKTIKGVFRERRPDVVYINGMFLFLYNLLPLFLARLGKIRVVMSPRGMLQDGAMSNGRSKKRLFLKLLKWSGLINDITWHATDEQEEADIKKHFGQNTRVKIASNIPTAPLPTIPVRAKTQGQLRIVYLSLISRKKNLKLALKAVAKLNGPVEFHIYGPIKDPDYWEECLTIIKSIPFRIEYKGVIQPENVQQTLQQYHVLILPTLGENFGHAIYESLSAGTPVLISPHTPWQELDSRKAGLTIGLHSEDGWIRALETVRAWDQHGFDEYSQGAYRYALDYFRNRDFRKNYNDIFGP